jgi:hypothetical protein
MMTGKMGNKFVIMTGKFNFFLNAVGRNEHNSNNQNRWRTGIIARSEILTAVLLKFRSSGGL